MVRMRSSLNSKNIRRTKLLLLSFLTENGIRFSQVLSADMKEKAVVEFSLDLGATRLRVGLHKKMNRDEARTCLCSMFAMLIFQ